ncbi:hypothetical protein TUMSATVNIG1_60260 (plasmid) [Vibrio nigripulchritudo]|uniref:hypothetical protein n=1 Tax=Vibrio nigripulchritudo TaxID=28173 RepID=UPI00190B3F75|nr:hypothetical protein [Vibrio nigripulchritudo]BCL74040.1 hypothetical protein VNTUMSATTG_59770 [Vibrio nigripulchritudo]BDU35417.1 hypothetical protein TUMSATVNIG1_60260 [Vibrio nigripulchritudo]
MFLCAKTVRQSQFEPLLTAFNRRQLIVVEEISQSMTLANTVALLIQGGASIYHKLPELSKNCIKRLLEGEPGIPEVKLEQQIVLLSHHIDEREAAKWIVEIAGINQLHQLMDYSLSHDQGTLFLTLTLEVGEDFDWQNKKLTYLEKAYTVSGESGWLNGVTHALENRGARVSDDFENNLQFWSRVGPNHKLHDEETYSRVVGYFIDKGLMLDENVSLLRHRVHLFRCYGHVLRDAAQNLISKEELVQLLPAEILQSVDVIETNNIVFSLSADPLLVKSTHFWVKQYPSIRLKSNLVQFNTPGRLNTQLKIAVG